jgi:hypothetical protein
LYKKDADASKKWFEAMRLVLLKEGSSGLAERLKVLQLDKERFHQSQ